MLDLANEVMRSVNCKKFIFCATYKYAKASSEAVAALREENNKLRELIVLLNQDRADKDLYIEQLRFILIERSQ